MKKIVLLSFVTFLFIACNNGKIVKKTAVGKANYVLVVIDNAQWQDEIGDAVRDVLAESLVGFPQEEPRFTLSQIAPENFNTMLKNSSNIVSISFTDKNSFKVLKDKYAAPQRIVVITAKDKDNLVTLLQEHKKDIIKTFNNSDIKNSQAFQLKNTWDYNSIKTFKNNKFHFQIPVSYLKVQDTLNYIWFRRDIPEGYLNLQAYVIPIQSEEEFNGENIIKYRNEKGKQFIPGDKEGSYVTTEDAYTPIQYNTTMLGRKTIETHGIWEMKNGFMAGPFINYALLDKKNKRIIVIEGFVYAPNISKRNYLFELEALLKTLEIND